MADKPVFDRVKQTFGGRVRYFISGLAPLSRDIAEFFDVVGLDLGGLRPHRDQRGELHQPQPAQPVRVRLGRFPMPGTECKLMPEDGEILISEVPP